ncbi:hypothetical protein FQA39_LY13603 [Lamprigera yunnana]|nr:hypothetical protein FQA39_LY13603 [Lamprigera yunnana]
MFRRSKQYFIFKEDEWIKFHEKLENSNKYFQTCDMMWNQEKKILRIEDVCGNEVYLVYEFVSELWSLETVLNYRLSHSSASNFKHFYDDLIRVVAEISGDANTSIYNILDRLSEKSDNVCGMFEMWILHAEQHWAKAIDLKSAVECLYEKLGALKFEADHEVIYGMEEYYKFEQCEQLRDKYKIGRKVCRHPLTGKYCSQCLKDRLLKIGLQHFLDTTNKYISNSDTSDKEESKAAEQNGEGLETTKKSKKSKGEKITKPVS